MAMTWTKLTGLKTVNGSIASWVNYSRLDTETILDEAQALLYSLLRVREMRSRFIFRMEVGMSKTDLPARCLDGIGRMFAPSLNMEFVHKDESYVNNARVYNPEEGSIPLNAFGTTIGDAAVRLTLPGHDFTQGSVITTSGTLAVGGLDTSGTFDIVYVDGNDLYLVNGNGSTDVATATVASGGGSGGTYVCDVLQLGAPAYWAVWDENIYFDCAFVQDMNITLQFYRSLPLLSADNETNFLTDRYPHLLRTACVTAAADFMKDDTEYQKGLTRLTALVGQTNSENDMGWRGLELDTETP